MAESPSFEKPEFLNKAEGILDAFKTKDPEMDLADKAAEEKLKDLRDGMDLKKVVDAYVKKLPEDLKTIGYSEKEIGQVADAVQESANEQIAEFERKKEEGFAMTIEQQLDALSAKVFNPENFPNDVDERIAAMKKSPFKMKLIAFGMGWILPYIDKFSGPAKKEEKEEAPKSDEAEKPATEVSEFDPEILEGKTIYELANWENESEKPAVLTHLKAKFESIADGLERVTPASSGADGIQKPAILHFANGNDFELIQGQVGLAGEGGETPYSDFDDLKSIIKSTGSVDA